MRREFLSFTAPGMQDGRRTYHERRLRILRVALPHPRQPDQCLQGFAQAHVVRQDAAQFEFTEMAEKIEALVLVGAQVSDNVGWESDVRDPFEISQALL